VTAWSALDGGTGTVLAVAGEVAIAAQLGTLTVWSDGEPAVTIHAEVPNPARPRVVGRRVHWGPHVVDLDNGTHDRLVPTGDVLPGYAQTAHAWARGGDAAMVAGRWTDPAGHPRAVAALVDGDGARPTMIWEAREDAPVALWVGDATGVVGTRSPEVVDRAGRLVRVLTGTSAPFRIDGDGAGARLLVAEHATLGVWNLADGELLGRCSGTFVDAALTPDGRRVVTVDFSGRMRVHAVAPELPLVTELDSDDPALAVAVTDDRIVAAFAAMPAIRTSSLPREP
jgi:hypothetical protein